MVYSDLCIRTEDVEKSLELGGRLGLDTMGLIVPLEKLARLDKFRKKRGWREKPRLALGVEVRTEKHGQLRKFVTSLRRSAEIVLVCGGTAELNRMAVEIPEADILLGHDINGQCGINHVLARLAKKNNVSIGFDFNQLMTSYRLGRIQGFSAMVDTAKVVRKFKAPFVLTSGARDPWDMRSPSELIAMGRLLGFSEAEARKGLSDHIVRDNRKRLSGKWVMPGVEVE
jgi:ribonuclease P/MRP protein subunit RPP1